MGTPCVTNVRIPDGYKDTPVNRRVHRELLKESLDQVFAQPLDPRYNPDAVEAKLFGIGSESYVVGSHEFYMGYAVSRETLLCLDIEADAYCKSAAMAADTAKKLMAIKAGNG